MQVWTQKNTSAVAASRYAEMHVVYRSVATNSHSVLLYSDEIRSSAITLQSFFVTDMRLMLYTLELAEL